VDTDRIEGKTKEYEGKTQQKWGEAKDKAEDTWEDVKDKAEDVGDKAEEELRGMGIDAEIIDLRTIRPMDLDTVIESVKKTNRLVTVEEGFPQSSVGDHIAAQVMQRAFDHLDAPVITIAGKDVPMPYAANLEKLALPSVAEVVEAVKAVTYQA
jgi:pyruvate dehydrogenase E1 component beta subunit